MINSSIFELERVKNDNLVLRDQLRKMDRCFADNKRLQDNIGHLERENSQLKSIIG